MVTEEVLEIPGFRIFHEMFCPFSTFASSNLNFRVKHACIMNRHLDTTWPVCTVWLQKMFGGVEHLAEESAGMLV